MTHDSHSVRSSPRSARSRLLPESWRGAGLLGLASVGFVSGAVAATITLDTNGVTPGGVVTATDLVWGPTSFVARGAIIAANNFANGNCLLGACDFDVLSHATLTKLLNNGSDVTPAGLGTSSQLTMTMGWRETVTSINGGTVAFSTTGSGWLQWFALPIYTANALTGFGFDQGTLILNLSGVAVGTAGSLTVSSGPPVLLDQVGTDDYGGQLTVSATGTVGALSFGTAASQSDAAYVLSQIGTLVIAGLLPASLPYTLSDPSDCFTPGPRTAPVGTVGISSTCDNVHVSGPFSSQLNPAGYTPSTGVVNGISGPDFDPQIEFTASAVPEFGTLPMMVSALVVGLCAGASRSRPGGHALAG